MKSKLGLPRTQFAWQPAAMHTHLLEQGIDGALEEWLQTAK
jgi:hypothetical protein